MAKITKCTICNSRWTAEVNDMIKHGVPLNMIAEYLGDKGIEISRQSVFRHKKNHVLADKKPRQLQKRGIQKAQNKANPQKKKSITQKLKADQKAIQNSQPSYARTPADRAKQIQYEKELEKMAEDVDVISEMLYILAVSKDRVERGLAEEATSGLVLATTGAAIKDYTSAVKTFHDLTAGMESITKLRFAQLVQLVGNVFVQQPLTDRSRLEMLSLLEDHGGPAEEIVPIRPNSNQPKSK